MLIRVRHTLNAAGLVAVIALATTTVSMTSSAGATGAKSFATGGLVAPLPGAQGVVSPSLLIRNGEGSFGSFSGESPQSLTVDQATGDIYAIEPSAGKLWRFAANGTAKNFTAGPDASTNSITGLSFQGFPGLDQVAVDSSSGPAKGDIYVTESGQHRVKVFASTGEPLGTLTGSGNPNGGTLGEDCGIAVDQSNGDVYIANRGFDIWRYTPTSNTVSEADYSGGIETSIEPCQLAVAGSSLYAKQWQEFPILSAGVLQKYSTSAFMLEELGFGSGPVIAQNVTAVATDPSTGDVYADFGNKITVFGPAGSPLYTFGSSSDFGSESVGVTVDSSSGTAYVADPLNHRIDQYGPAVVAPPTAITGQASEIRHVKATLNGHLDLNEGPEITDCHFDWGTTTAYGNTAPCEQGNTYTSPADVSATITGLEPGKTYHYRLVASAETNTGTGSDQTFETVPLPILYNKLAATFGSSGSGDGQLSDNTALAIDQTSGDLYVADTNNHRIEQFDADGTFISAFGWGVKDGKAEAETCTNNCLTGISGSGVGQLSTPVFIAVDNSGGPSNGDIYVGDTTNNTVIKYDADGNYISTNDGTSSGSAFGPLAGIAVSTKGDLWAYDTNAEMREFAQDGTFTTQWNSNFEVTPAGIAIDATETLYVVRKTPVVEKLSPTGTDLGVITANPGEPTFNGPTTGLAVDPLSGDLYVDDGGTSIRLYANPSTCVAHGNQGLEGCNLLDTFGSGDLNAASGVAVSGSSGRLYVSDPDTIKIFDPATPPDVTTGSSSAPSATTATLTGTVNPNGVALTDCHFEYVSDAAFLSTGFTDLSSGGTAPCSPNAGSIPTDLEDHAVTATITGLDPTIVYHFRLVAANAQTIPTNGKEAIVSSPPLVETTGSPTRTATTARLDSRLDPRGAATSYHFEYGDQGPCETNPCTSTPNQAAGDGETYELVSQQLTGLKANTTYHYRLVAENGIPDGAADGQDFTVTTRASDAPLTHGHLPGPPDSDRAWEQVNVPDTDGNPVDSVKGISDSGERAMYDIAGGSPGSTYGGETLGTSNEQFAERTTSGWRDRNLYPKRSEAPGNVWWGPWSGKELNEVYDINNDVTNSGEDIIFRLTPGASPRRLFGALPSFFNLSTTTFFTASEDGSRMVGILLGTNDPAYPLEEKEEELYDFSNGSPKLIGLLPDNTIPACGVTAGYMTNGAADSIPANQRWLTSDGAHAFFSTAGVADCSVFSTSLYDRDLVNGTTTLIAPKGRFIRYAAGAVFFDTSESLVPGDRPGNDIYRYQVDNHTISCLTCSTPAPADIKVHPVRPNDFDAVAVSNDGSRVYFVSQNRLLPGAATPGIYRLDVENDALAYVASDEGEGSGVSMRAFDGGGISSDGAVLMFWSTSGALNAVNGQQNGGTGQFYRYDDRNRSVLCVSCPPEGSAPRYPTNLRDGGGVNIGGPGPVDDAGDVFFTTPNPLVPADQNTATAGQSQYVGTDVYEWRDGRLLLVTDGRTESKGSSASFVGVTSSGRDAFFMQAAALTPDAIDSSNRLYDARIGGGFGFVQPPPPCSLEACQGTPLPPPSDGTPASLSFSGPGNGTGKPAASVKQTKKGCAGGKCVRVQRKARCAKGKMRKRGKCVKRVARKRAKRSSHSNRGGAK